MRFPFIGAAYSASSPRVDAQECINLFPETDESGSGANVASLLTVPGLAAWGSVPTTPIRGLWGGDGRLFAVGGSKLYEVSSGGVASLRGDVGNDGQAVDIWPNGNMLMIVSAGYVYIDTGSSIIQPNWIGTSDKVTAGSGTFMDGYFIATQPNSKKFFISGIMGINPVEGGGDTYDWDGGEFGVKEASPDNVNAIWADHQELWVAGFETIEVWRDTGNADFPFQRDPGAMIHLGLMARRSPASIAGGVAFLGGDRRGGPAAYICQGYVPVRISTHALEQQWEKYSTVTDAVGYAYTEGGHSFYVLSFPSGNATWVWDATTKLWHRRGFWTGYAWDRQRGVLHTYEFGRHILADWQNGNLYQASMSIDTELSNPIKWRRTAPHILEELGRYPHNRFRLFNSGSASMTMAYSDDGATSWTSEKNPSGPVIAECDPSKVIGQEWRRLGTSKDRIYRVTGSGRAALVDAYVNSKD